MTLEQLQKMKNELVQAIHDYTQEKDFNSVELERTLDEMLCCLPRDIIYVEWFDRSDIKNIADSHLNNEDADEDLVDMCMEDLDRFNGSIMENETVEQIICDTIRYKHKGADNDD